MSAWGAGRYTNYLVKRLRNAKVKDPLQIALMKEGIKTTIIQAHRVIKSVQGRLQGVKAKGLKGEVGNQP